MPACALDRTAFAFTATDLQVTLDPAQHALYAEGTLELPTAEAPQRDVVLQISSTLRWMSVLANGEEVEWLQQFYTTDVDHTGALSEAIVHLPKAIEPGGTVKLRCVTAAWSPRMPPAWSASAPPRRCPPQ